jgi:hypothetical protein
MAHPTTLLAIVKNGSDLTLLSPVHPDTIRQLALEAQKSGARLTLPTAMHPDLVNEISSKYGKSVAFIDGTLDFKKN